MMKLIISIIIIVMCMPGVCRGASELCDYVDPFIGTGGHGHTYPGAALPFGMVQLSPDTRLTGWDGCSGYHYSDRVIYGFSHTHLSGTGVSDYGDILIMPYTGKVTFHRGEAKDTASGYCSSFSHDRETASPGYYSVYLQDYGIHAELTVTPRTGIHRYTFPAAQDANIIIDLTHRDEVIESGIEVHGNREVHGFRRSSAWAKDQHVYFAARFSKPFYKYTIAGDKSLPPAARHVGKSMRLFSRHSGVDGAVVLQFHTGASAGELVIKVGISAVDIAGAVKNLEAETKGSSFAHIRTAAWAQWQQALSKIIVEGGSKTQKRIFYTSLYHALLNPNLYTDSDGRYRGRDLHIHQAKDFTDYTVFSLWDTFRALHPLFTIIEPERTKDFIKTFLAQYRQGGLLPVWELAANETNCMIGYHAVSVISDAYGKGIRGFDIAEAYKAMTHSTRQNQWAASPAHEGSGNPVPGRIDKKASITGKLSHVTRKNIGYIPAEEEAESVSKTLEYAYDDWCIAQLAKALDKKKDYRYYLQRAQSYKNLFDPFTGFMRARMRGAWFTPFDPAEVNFNYTEANSWQYSFYVPQDIRGFIALMGGKEAFIRKLDALFSADTRTSGRQQADITGLIGQYAQGNEPSHHMAYLYCYANRPWKTQGLVRRIMDTLYGDNPAGLCGNEDCGQMSAWYILSAMGFYPVTPGQPTYVIGTPLFEKVSIDVGKDKTFEILAPGVSGKNIYIQALRLNGQPSTKSWLAHADIVKGGTLEFTMGPEPNKKWGSRDRDIPFSAIIEHPVVPVPYVALGSPIFNSTTKVALAAVEPGARIYYTMDGSMPSKASNLYKQPILLDRSVTLKAMAVKEGMTGSLVLSARFHKLPTNIDIRLKSRYAPQYSAGGDRALIDGIRGSGDFKTGTWQGYEGTDLEAIIDLGKTKTIHKLTTGFLQDNNAWIFMPLQVDYYISAGGRHFTHIAAVKSSVSHRQTGTIVKDFTAAVAPTPARYIKVIAKVIGVCPSWHKGAGNKSWIFADEILVE